MLVRALVVLSTACVIGACSLGALDGFSGGGDGIDAAASETGAPAADGAPGSDASGSNDSGTGADTGTPEPHGFNDTFEIAGTCDPWTTSRTNAQTASPGRTGSLSCRACTTDTTGGGIRRIIRSKPPATTLPPGEYTFTVWVKDPSYTGTIAFELYELTAALEKGPYRGGQPKALTADWAAHQLKFFSAQAVPGWRIDLYVDNSPPVDTCFSADDATLVYTP